MKRTVSRVTLREVSERPSNTSNSSSEVFKPQTFHLDCIKHLKQPIFLVTSALSDGKVRPGLSLSFLK